MTELKKQRMKSVLKYTWPFYLVLGFVIFLAMGIIFRVTHPIPAYKSLTIFVSGEVTGREKLSEDMYAKFKEKKIRSFSCIESKPTDLNYSTKLTVSGYQSADVLIIPTSKIDTVSDPSTFALKISDVLVNAFYSGCEFYTRDEIKYGVKIDKEKVSEYMSLPEEECYMFLNGASKNLGDYGLKPVTEHDMALTLVKDWGK